jgi:hypothetical protein
VRTALIGAAIAGLYRYLKPRLSAPARRTYDGLSAIFPTREQADLAVEHLVQEYRVDRALIYVDPIGEANSAGTTVSGGDHASGRTGSHDRIDGSLHGAIEVTVPLGQDNEAILRRALIDAGGQHIAVF